MENINLYRYKEYHGRTLEEIARTTGPRLHGYAVFMICVNEPDDVLGDLVGEGLTVAEILQENPHLADWVVKYTNNYEGQIVLRLAKPAEVSTEDHCIFCGDHIQAGEVYCKACAPIAESLEPDKRRQLEKLLEDEKARAAFYRDFQKVTEALAACIKLIINEVTPILERIAETGSYSKEG